MQLYNNNKNPWEFFSHRKMGHSHSHLLSFPFLPISIPKLESYSYSHGIFMGIGNPIPMAISKPYLPLPS